MNFLFLSTHAFLPNTRKTSVHFVSEALAARGHSVETLSVGYSLLTALKSRDLYRQLSREQKGRFRESASRYRSACYLPLLHPFSTGSALFNRAMSPFFDLYGRVLPRFMREAVLRADTVVIESGTSIVFFEAVRRLKPAARTIYFARDLLNTVGASEYLQRLERRIAPQFDRVIVPSSRMAEHLPSGSRVVFVPQGIDKSGFDVCDTSPYPAGSRNGVAVGNMLFDKNAMTAMALHAPDVTFHFFGAGIPADFPQNVTVYGERAFSDIIPYLKFADFGIAPYRLTERELYLVESSLKLQQYSYCLLPILAPELMRRGCRANIVAYDPNGETDWAGKVREAATRPHDPAWRDGIATWDDVADRIADEAVSA
ncbi:glycosyltransferase [Rhizobiaceae bacterium BDR2-2]|uniref:Glycosyltransferase n=1 Tax=Ectorhizobium quercum TaxID=2965071 RepID=A0AAE3N0C7_9HYPH|nr:glycosyltransferase [Ectorhizobium quercum]MCX8996512.1 glycosyltransferase [Ectorhizobium quercum]